MTKRRTKRSKRRCKKGVRKTGRLKSGLRPCRKRTKRRCKKGVRKTGRLKSGKRPCRKKTKGNRKSNRKSNRKKRKIPLNDYIKFANKNRKKVWDSLKKRGVRPNRLVPLSGRRLGKMYRGEIEC